MRDLCPFPSCPIDLPFPGTAQNPKISAGIKRCEVFMAKSSKLSKLSIGKSFTKSMFSWENLQKSRGFPEDPSGHTPFSRGYACGLELVCVVSVSFGGLLGRCLWDRSGGTPCRLVADVSGHHGDILSSQDGIYLTIDMI